LRASLRDRVVVAAQHEDGICRRELVIEVVVLPQRARQHANSIGHLEALKVGRNSKRVNMAAWIVDIANRRCKASIARRAGRKRLV
jgi:hypothetical protein